MRLRWAIPIALALNTACSSQSPSTATSPAAAAPAPDSGRIPLQALVTLQDLMRDEVDASGDAIWDSVGTISSRESGTVERQPHTDAEWVAVRQHAVVLLESTNLLVIPGRQVSAKPFASDGPGVNSSEQIQDRLDNHRAEFNALALGLRAVAVRILGAVDSKDPQALQSAGGDLDAACEACHMANWYPHEVIPELPAVPPPPP